MTLPHVFMVNRDGTGCRQVTDSKKSGEKSGVFSPEGDSLLVPTVEGCNDLIRFGRAPDLVHKVPADATLADVTQETQSTFCACAAQIKTGLHWHLEPIT